MLKTETNLPEHAAIGPERVSGETSPSHPITRRLVSLDALRGFDLLWIVGTGSLVHALRQNGSPVAESIARQLTHVQWQGLHCYDVIFPLFLFIVGASSVFSLDKALASGKPGVVFWRVVRRAALLFALGVFVDGGLSRNWPEIKLSGVLQRTAACYLVSAALYVWLRSYRRLFVAAFSLLGIYWALLAFVPFPDLRLDKANVSLIASRIGTDAPATIAASVSARASGVYEEGRNLTNYLDFRFLPGRKTTPYYSNEGLLSTMTAAMVAVFGLMAGLLLKDRRFTDRRKCAVLAGFGLAAVVLGLGWGLEFPIIKRVWSSSFVLLTSGICSILLAVFYYLIDVRGWRTWAQPFGWIGANALTIYVGTSLVGISSVAERFTGGSIKAFLDENLFRGAGGMVVAMAGWLVAIIVARFLHRRSIFIRV